MILASCQTIFSRDFGTSFYVSIESVWGKHFVFEKKNCFLIFFGNWEIFRLLCKNSRQVCQNWLLLPIGTFQAKFFWRANIFFHLLTLKETFLTFPRWIFGGVVETALYVPVGSFWRKKFFGRKWYFSHHFLSLSNSFFGSFVWKFFEKIIKKDFVVCIETFWSKPFLKKLPFLSSSIIELQIFGLLSKFSAGLSKPHSACPLEPCQESYSFL